MNKVVEVVVEMEVKMALGVVIEKKAGGSGGGNRGGEGGTSAAGNSGGDGRGVVMRSWWRHSDGRGARTSVSQALIGQEDASVRISEPVCGRLGGRDVR